MGLWLHCFHKPPYLLIPEQCRKEGKMKKFIKRLTVLFFIPCLITASVLLLADTASANKIPDKNHAEAKALKKVKNAVVEEVDKDYENGNLVYEVKLHKGNKEYELEYRASDGKLLSYEWELKNISPGTGKNLSKAACKKLALNKVKNGRLLSITRDYDDNIMQYKVKLEKGHKKYTLEYNAKTGKLLQYKWKIV